MRPLHRLRRRLRVWLRRDAVEREMDDEMRFHLEMEIRERVETGTAPRAARRAALRSFGGVERFKEEARDARGGRWLEDLAADARYALRGLRRSPGFAVTAVLTLGLGIGATSAVFSAIDAVLLEPLPYPAPERLVRIYQQNSPANRWTISIADWLAIEEQQKSFVSAALLDPDGATLSTPSGAEWVRAGRVTAGFFRTLGVPLARGAGFREGDDEPGAPRVVVVTHELARRHFGEADAVGRTLVLDRQSYAVVGVLPRGVRRLAGLEADVWPILQPAPPPRRGPFGYIGIARLADGVTLDAAARDLAGISERIFPIWAAGFQDRTARLTPYPLREVIVGDAARSLRVFALAVAVVLLIAVANVSNLVLVRAAGRGREMALRSALGARSSRLTRLLLTESFVLAALGGAAGLAVALLGLEALNAVGPELPRLEEARLDVRAIAFTGVVALVSGALVGSYPMVSGMTRSLASSLRAGGRGAGASRRTQLFQGALVAAEFALALPLLLAAGLLLHSFVNLRRVDPGFDPRNILTTYIMLPPTAYADAAAVRRFWDEALRRVRDVPGVVEVGLTTSLPPDNYGDTNNFDLLEKPVEPGTAEPVAPWAWATPELFATLGVPLLEGRLFEPLDDDSAAAPVLLVSRAWAERWFPGESAVGKRLYAGGCRECEPFTIVGVVGDVKYEGLAGGGEAVYESARQAPRAGFHLVMRTAVDASSVAAQVRERIRSLDPNLALRELGTMENRLSGSIANPRRLTWLLGAFAAAAVVLAALGVFGVLSYAVARQRQEIGVRMALGADRRAVIAMVLRRGLKLAAVGLALGVLLALPGTRVLEAVLFQVSATEPVMIVATSALLLLVAVIACLMPGRRAARIEPVEAMAVE